LDLRTVLRAVRRHKAIFGILVVLGIAGGIGYSIIQPPLLASQALVIVSGTKSIRTQAIVASSDPVLIAAKRRLDQPISLETLRRRIQVTSITPSVLAITAEGQTADEAQDLANAVAVSYKAFLDSPGNPAGRGSVHLLERATPPTGATARTHAIEMAGLGALIGALLGVIVAVAMGRSDRHLRERDEIAGAIGIPVLASIPVVHPSDTAGWTRLLEEYEPAVVDAWNLRKVIRHLGLSDVRIGSGPGTSVIIVSLSSDRRALVLGPQLAVFAASLGIPTVLSVGAQQDPHATATLSAACTMAAASLSGELGALQFAVGDLRDAGRLSGAALTVTVAVVDSRDPQLVPMTRTSATMLAVSSGAVTAEQLARVAVSVASDGRDIAGLLVADPDSTDRTTGRLPQLAQLPRRKQPSQHRQPSQQRPPTHQRASRPVTSTRENRT
jgi:capsular polysaccharide biosynthesis protein